ncbi:MAG: hypothetical protein R3F34_12745 [Planctomycetota bacterium]
MTRGPGSIVMRPDRLLASLAVLLALVATLLLRSNDVEEEALRATPVESVEGVSTAELARVAPASTSPAVDRVAIASEDEPVVASGATVRGRVAVPPNFADPDIERFAFARDASVWEPLADAEVFVFPADLEWSAVPGALRRTPGAVAGVVTTTTDDEGRFEVRGLDATKRWRSLVLARGGCTPGLTGVLHRGEDEVTHMLEPLHGAACRAVDENERPLGRSVTERLSLHPLTMTCGVGLENEPVSVVRQPLVEAALIANGVDAALLDEDLRFAVLQGPYSGRSLTVDGQVVGYACLERSFHLFSPGTLPDEFPVHTLHFRPDGTPLGSLRVVVDARLDPLDLAAAGAWIDLRPIGGDEGARHFVPLVRDTDGDALPDPVVDVDGLPVGHYRAVAGVRSDGSPCVAIEGSDVVEITEDGLAALTAVTLPVARLVVHVPDTEIDPQDVGIRFRVDGNSRYVPSRAVGDGITFVGMPSSPTLLEVQLPYPRTHFGWVRTGEGQDAAMAALRERFPAFRSTEDVFAAYRQAQRKGATDLPDIAPLFVQVGAGETLEGALVLEPLAIGK